MSTASEVMANKPDNPALPLPASRCLTKPQAAQYLGIGVTLVGQIGPPPTHLGRRCVYDVLDLDRWFDTYKHRGRANARILTPVNKDPTDLKTCRTDVSIPT